MFNSLFQPYWNVKCFSTADAESSEPMTVKVKSEEMDYSDDESKPLKSRSKNPVNTKSKKPVKTRLKKVDTSNSIKGLYDDKTEPAESQTQTENQEIFIKGNTNSSLMCSIFLCIIKKSENIKWIWKQLLILSWAKIMGESWTESNLYAWDEGHELFVPLC